jgi:hypothetical protein
MGHVEVIKGAKTGGRRAGTPSCPTAELQYNLEALGCDPIEGRIAMDESQPMALRASMYRELAQLPGSTPPVFVIDIGEKPD